MAKAESVKGKSKQIPIREDFFTAPLWPVEGVRLKGSKCQSCGEVFLGKAVSCQSCFGEEMGEVVFSDRGTLWTYTIITSKPPGDYKGPEPFEPFGLGLVELPEGIRVLSPLTGCDVGDLKIGMKLGLVVEKLYEDEEGREVLSYKFKAIGGGSKR